MIRKWRWRKPIDDQIQRNIKVYLDLKMADNPAFILDTNNKVEGDNFTKSLELGVNNNRNKEDDFRDQNAYTETKKESGRIRRLRRNTNLFFERKKMAIRYGMLAILNMAVFAYFFVALNYWYTYDRQRKWEFCDGFGMLLILYSIVYFYLIYFLIVKPYFGRAINNVVFKPIGKLLNVLWKIRFSGWVLSIIILAGLATFFALDTEDSRTRLISLGGYAILLIFGFVFSSAPTKIIWRPVIGGVGMHFVMAMITIRWSVGRAIFQCIGDKVAIFLSFADVGSAFVFSDFLIEEIGVFAFKVLTVIFFFSLMIEMMFYLGAMQWVCMKLGWCLQATMGTTVCESVICAANTFLGMTESPLLVKPYIPDLTRSEIHTIMTSGFATVSGSVLAAYISFGVQPAQLVTATVMAAPAALAFSKMFFPELEKSETALNTIKPIVSEESSILDAATRGASNAIPLVLGIASNLIGFLALVAFLNAIFGWLGLLVGLDFLSFEWLFGKIFIPLSWIMGVPWSECELVGSLIGLKTVINEFVAYERLGKYKEQGLLSERGETIATFALCGFTNPSSLGILVGGLSAMAPSKRSDFAAMAGRAFVSACCVCFMNACMAGLLVTPGSFSMPPSGNGTNTTMFI